MEADRNVKVVGCSLGWARPRGNTVIPVECLWRGRVAVVFLILKWRRLHSKNSAWLSDSSTCVAWNQWKFIDNWVRHAVMALWTWKMCVRGCDSSKKVESLVTWGVQVLRSPGLFKKNYSPQEIENAVISQRNHPVDIHIFHNAHDTTAWPQQTLL